jgi:hypothetical protein
MADQKMDEPEIKHLIPALPSNVQGGKKRNLKWVSDLEACEIGEFMIVSLTTSRSLREEGREMKHCVGRYDELCHNGLFRVFSIRDLLDRRLATMSLKWANDYWRLDQLGGVRSADVGLIVETYFDGERTVTRIEQAELYYVAHEVLRLYRHASDVKLNNLIVQSVANGKLHINL